MRARYYHDINTIRRNSDRQQISFAKATQFIKRLKRFDQISGTYSTWACLKVVDAQYIDTLHEGPPSVRMQEKLSVLRVQRIAQHCLKGLHLIL